METPRSGTAGELDAALRMLTKLNVTEYRPTRGARYPETDFGTGLMQIAQLIKADVGLEVACIDIGGWDTHAHQGGAKGIFADLLAELGEGMAALFIDLNVMFLMGGNVVGKKVHGDWPTLAPAKLTSPGDLTLTTDYRDVLSEVLSKSLGNTNIAAVFPGFVPKPRGALKIQ